MEGAYETLLGLDPSDSMERTLDAVRSLLEHLDRTDAGDRAKALELIRIKEKEAMEYYLRPLDDDSVYNRLIALHTDSGDKGLVSRYKRALDIRQARKWTVQGDAQAVVGNNTKAAMYLKRALFFGPMEDVEAEVRSALDRSEKRIAKARKEVEKALAKAVGEPGSEKALKEACHCLIDLDRLDEALEMNDRYLSSSPGPDPKYQRGCILFSKGDYEEALGIFEELRTALPDSLNVKRCYNWTLQMLGRQQD